MSAEPTPYYPGPLALPSDRAWLDPALVGRQLYFRTTDVTAAGASVVPVAVPNPYRWAVGFARSLAPPSSLILAPWADFTVAAGWDMTTGNPLWFHLRDYGPLIMSGWSGSFGGPGTVRVLEAIRRTEG